MIRPRLRRTGAVPGLRELGDRRRPLWLAPATILAFDSMPDFRTLHAGGHLSDRPPRLKIFISHPWETPAAPDPTGWQWARIRDAALHIVGEEFLPAYPHAGVSPDARWLPPSAGRFLVRQARRIEPAPLHPPGVETLYRTREIAGRKSVGFWLDYCCLPQGTRDADEEHFFRRLLARNCELATTSHVLAVWRDEREQLGRAWCLSEVALGRWGSQAASVALGAEDAEPASAPAPKFRLGDLGAPVREAADALQEAARAAPSTAAMREWLAVRGIAATREDDLRLIAASLQAAVSPARRLGARAVLWNATALAIESLWWSIAFVFIAPAPLAALALASADRVAPDEKPTLGQAVGFVALTFCWGLLNGIRRMATMALFPLEAARRLCASAFERCRADAIERAVLNDR